MRPTSPTITKKNSKEVEILKPFSPHINQRSKQLAAKAVEDANSGSPRFASAAGAPNIYERTKWLMEKKKAREANALSATPTATHFITPKSRSLAIARLEREIKAAFGLPNDRDDDDDEEEDLVLPSSTSPHGIIIVDSPRTLATVMNRLIRAPHSLMREENDADDENNVVVRLYKTLTVGAPTTSPSSPPRVTHHALTSYMTSVMFSDDKESLGGENGLRAEIRRLMTGRLASSRGKDPISSPSFSSPYLRSKSLVASPIPSFTPHINSKSRTMDHERSLKLGLDVSKPREEQIQQEYRLKADKRSAIDIVRSQMEECSFKPHIITVRRSGPSAAAEEVTTTTTTNPGVRLYRAAERRRKERQDEVREAISGERLAKLLGSPEFTFHPRLHERPRRQQQQQQPPSFTSTVERLRRASQLKEERAKEMEQREREAEERIRTIARSAKRDAKGLIVPEPFELRTSSSSVTAMLAPYGARSPPRPSADAVSLFKGTLRSEDYGRPSTTGKALPSSSSSFLSNQQTVLVGGSGPVLFYVTLALGDGAHYEVPVRRGADPVAAAAHIASAYRLSEEHQLVLETTIRGHLLELGETGENERRREEELAEVGTVRVVLRPGVEVAVDLVPGDDCGEIASRIADDYGLPDDAREALKEQLEVYLAHLAGEVVEEEIALDLEAVEDAE